MSDDLKATQGTTLTWHLMVFDKQTERLVTGIALSADQITALRPYMTGVDTEGNFGCYPVSGVDWFAEEHLT